MFHGDLDQNVGIGESRLMANRLRSAGKKVELVEFKGLAHSLDDTEARTTLLDRSDMFLRATMGIQ
jgi:dipeptidyl aminopeptidase/acylaminoacyl peptidase